MAAIYLHLTGRAHIGAVLKTEGITTDEEECEETTPFRMDTCPTCGVSIGKDMTFCPSCGHPLDGSPPINPAIKEVTALKEDDEALRALPRKTLAIATGYNDK